MEFTEHISLRGCNKCPAGTCLTVVYFCIQIHFGVREEKREKWTIRIPREVYVDANSITTRSRNRQKNSENHFVSLRKCCWWVEWNLSVHVNIWKCVFLLFCKAFLKMLLLWHIFFGCTMMDALGNSALFFVSLPLRVAFLGLRLKGKLILWCISVFVGLQRTLNFPVGPRIGRICGYPSFPGWLWGKGFWIPQPNPW